MSHLFAHDAVLVRHRDWNLLHLDLHLLGNPAELEQLAYLNQVWYGAAKGLKSYQGLVVLKVVLH